MERAELFFSLGALAAHTSAGSKGFRPHELRLFAELFSNWIQFGGIGAVFGMHNTQIARFLRALVDDGQAKRQRKEARDAYRLTRAGLFNLVSQITNASYLTEHAHCLLVWYFLNSYAPQLRSQMAAAGNEFSRAHKLEMDALLDCHKFLERQIQLLDHEIARMKERFDAAHAMSSEVIELQSKGAALRECVDMVSERYPYELNSQLSFKELLTKIPEDVLAWELSRGSALKARSIFAPLHHKLQLQRQQLLALRAESP